MAKHRPRGGHCPPFATPQSPLSARNRKPDRPSESRPMTYTRLIATDAIPPEKSAVVEHGGKSLLVCHSKGEFFVVLNLCSHADEKLDCGRVRNGWVACPIHGARFNLATGAAMNPPAKEPIVTFPARVVDGFVEAELG